MENRFIETPIISIDNVTCSKCGLCSRVCPIKVFDFKKGEVPSIHNNDECVLCGQCLCVCSTNSINHSGFKLSNFKRIQNRQPFPPEIAFDFLSQRRSVRNYKKEVPSKELLEKILLIAGFAPGSPHHRVGWVRNVTVVTGAENIKIVLDMTAEYMQKTIKLLNGWMIKLAAKFDDSAKAGIAVVPSFKIALDELKNGRDSIMYNAPVAIFLHAPMYSSLPQIDCDAACMMIQLNAAANGLGTCWNGLIQGAASGDHLRGFTKLADFLKIPKGNKCYAAMTAGFPSVVLHSLPERRTDISWIIG